MKSWREENNGKAKDCLGSKQRLFRKNIKACHGKIVDDFKENIEELEGKGKTVAGTILNGGEGLTKGAQEVFDDYTEEMKSKEKFSIHNTNKDVNKIKESLQNKVKNKNKT